MNIPTTESPILFGPDTDFQADRFYRECDHPPFVLRCAHLGPRSIALIPLAAISHATDCKVSWRVDGYDLGNWEGVQDCPWCGALMAQGLLIAHRADLATAEAAFFEAEQKLLARELP